MITTRVLPRAEWDRLADTDLGQIWTEIQSKAPYIDILVAENDDGEIVGRVLFCLFRHAEGFTIVPTEQRQGRVARALLRGMRAYCQAQGIDGVWTGSTDPTIDALITRLGGRPLPGRHYVWSPGLRRHPEESICQPSPS